MSASNACNHALMFVTSSTQTRCLVLYCAFLLQAAKVAPKDPDLRKKLAECEKAIKRIKFEEALSTPVSNCIAVQLVNDNMSHCNTHGRL
jgi:hypothetical protein